MPLENLGEVIEQIRSNRNITIDSLCEGIMSHSTYHRFVRGKSNIASDSFEKISWPFTYDASDVFTRLSRFF